MIRFPWSSPASPASPSARAASPPLSPEREQARDIVSACGQKPEKNQIMCENVAGYVAHLRALGVGISIDGDRRSLLSQIDSAINQAGQPGSSESHLHQAGKLRWLSKLQRDVEAPYTDAQVGARLDHCCAELKELLPHFSVIPHQLYLVGGPIASGEGRFGANSDLDVVMTVAEHDRPQADKLAAQLTGRGRDHNTLQLYVTSDSQLPEVLGYFGHHEEIQAGQVGQVVRQGIESHGLEIGKDWRSQRVDNPPLHTELALKRFPSQLLTPLKR